ncbi:YkgJ family cysteine cluster protein [candidate division WOR-3 bacterium]|nr:YkgJ family cysteine cluster protein [candidate division WOR-3 bacterium]
MSKCFFENGIRFECQKCGACCDVEGGMVYLLESDLQKISSFLGISLPLFMEEYVTEDEDKNLVIKDNHPSKCRFLDRKSCQIHLVRPVQCRTFPFWSTLLKDENAFNSLACPGIGRGKIIEADKIREMYVEHRNFLARICGFA